MASKEITALHHTEAHRRNIPTAEYQSIMDKEAQKPVRLAYERRNRDLDPQLMWRGKDEQDAVDLIVHAPPLYIQEKVHPKALIEDLQRQSKARQQADIPNLFDWCHDFNGIPEGADKTDFYQHDGHWSNRMILGDSLQVMASLAEREGLRGQVQCIYFDPPYGIKFNSNFQWSTTSRDVKDGNKDHITREPEMVKAFRDTWRDGIHSYLSYIRDRLTVARDLLTESGSIFVQIGDENVHRVRAVMDEVFGEENFVSMINFRTAMTKPTKGLNNVFDYILWYAKVKSNYKYRPLYKEKLEDEGQSTHQLQASVLQDVYPFAFEGTDYNPTNGWRCSYDGMKRIGFSARLYKAGNSKNKIGTLKFIRDTKDFPFSQLDNTWNQQSSEQNKNYVVQTLLSKPSQTPG